MQYLQKGIGFAKNVKISSNELALNCSLANKDYMISITSDGYFNCSNCEKQVQEEIKNLIDFSNLNLSVKKVENYFDSLDGYCE